MRGRAAAGIAAAILMAAAIWGAEQARSPSRPATSDTARTVLQIEGMSCSACVARIKKTLRSIKGVFHVDVSLAKRQGQVRHAPALVSADSLARAVTGLGYRARVVPGGRTP